MGDEDRAYQDMLSDMESGECAKIQHDGSVFFCGKMICHPGTPEEDHMAVIKARMEAEGFFPNIYSVNDHGNVSLLDSDGKEIQGWV